MRERIQGVSAQPIRSHYFRSALKLPPTLLIFLIVFRTWKCREVEHDRIVTQAPDGGEGARYRRVRSDARSHPCACGGHHPARRLERQQRLLFGGEFHPIGARRAA